MTNPVDRFQRQAFDTLREPRWSFVAQLVRMLTSFQTGVLDSLAPLYRLPFLRGVEISVPALAAAGEFRVVHKLRRKPRGFLVLDVLRPTGSTASFAVYRRASALPDEATLTLWASGNFTSLTLWVW